MLVVGSRDIARTTRTAAAIVNCTFHRLDHHRVLAHAQIIIRAPNCNFVWRIRIVAYGAWKLTALALKFRKNAIIALIL